MRKHFRICGASSCIEKIFAAVGATVSIGALCYLVAKKCSLCESGCHCHGEIGGHTMDLDIETKQRTENQA